MGHDPTVDLTVQEALAATDDALREVCETRHGWPPTLRTMLLRARREVLGERTGQAASSPSRRRRLIAELAQVAADQTAPPAHRLAARAGWHAVHLASCVAAGEDLQLAGTLAGEIGAAVDAALSAPTVPVDVEAVPA